MLHPERIPLNEAEDAAVEKLASEHEGASLSVSGSAFTHIILYDDTPGTGDRSKEEAWERC